MLRDSRDGTIVHAPNDATFHQFVADRSNSSQQYLGAGDVVHAVTQAMGMSRCAPCAQRQAALNAAFPNVWRR